MLKIMTCSRIRIRDNLCSLTCVSVVGAVELQFELVGRPLPTIMHNTILRPFTRHRGYQAMRLINRSQAPSCLHHAVSITEDCWAPIETATTLHSVLSAHVGQKHEAQNVPFFLVWMSLRLC